MRPLLLLSAALGAMLVQPASACASECPEGVARALPVKAAIERPFGFRLDPVMGTAVFQPSMVFRTRSGQEVRAVSSGRVVLNETKPRGGRFVWIRQMDGSEVRYGPLAHTHVVVARCVLPGALLGRTTTSMFTLALRRNGAWIDPAPLFGDGR